MSSNHILKPTDFLLLLLCSCGRCARQSYTHTQQIYTVHSGKINCIACVLCRSRSSNLSNCGQQLGSFSFDFFLSIFFICVASRVAFILLKLIDSIISINDTSLDFEYNAHKKNCGLLITVFFSRQYLKKIKKETKPALKTSARKLCNFPTIATFFPSQH